MYFIKILNTFAVLSEFFNGEPLHQNSHYLAGFGATALKIDHITVQQM